MTRNLTRQRLLSEFLITVFAVAGFFIILGLVIALTPDISQITNSFFSDLTTLTYHLGSSGTVNLFAPAHPAQHTAFFRAVMDFLLAVGILQIIFLALRLWIGSSVRRITETLGNLVFWLGSAVVANVFLLAGTANGWFQFWAGLLLVLGISMIARFAVYLVAISNKKIS